MSDEIQKTIDRYLDRNLAEADEIDDVLARYTSQHASERLARRQRETTPDRVGLKRRGTSLTIMSPNSAFQSVVATLSEDERLVLADDGHGVEIVAGVEEDEEVEGEITVLRG
jgi:hypothetical protein